MSPFPGPAALGRGVVVLRDAAAPAGWPRVRVDDADVRNPRRAADELHRLWLGRLPVVVLLGAEAQALRAPETCDVPPWQLDPGFEFSRERLQYLVWSNNYDLRTDEPIWWHARRAYRIGATASDHADVTLPDGSPAWCDGGPRQPLDLPDLVIHRETIEAGSLRPDRVGPTAAALAPDQRAAVAHAVGPARIIAPAGSGKTRVLTERLRHLIADRAVTPGSITAVAYNTRAADELTQRTDGLPAHIRTLNSLGLAVVNGSGPFAATAPRREVIEEREVRRILESVVEVRHRANTDPMAAYIDALSAIRLGLADPKAVEEAIPDAAGIADAFDRYRDILTDRRLVDFDEQIYLAIEVLLRHPEARAHDQRATRHLLVDEFQDLTPAHLLLLRLLAAPTYDVFGVGDDDQVIYSYAGASPEFLIGYERFFPGAAAYALEVNYRCPIGVVDAARHLLTYNDRRIAKTIVAAPGREAGPADIRVDEQAGAHDYIAAWAAAGAAWSDIAVLTRVNSTLLPIQVTLIEAGIPCLTPLGRDILTRTGIRAALAYLRIGLDPDHITRADVAETIRRPSRRIARNVAEMLQKRATTSIGDIRRLADALSGGDVDKVASYADDIERIAAAVRTGTTAEALHVIRAEVGLGGAMDVLDSSRREADRSTHADDLAALEHVAALHPDPATFEHWLGGVLERPGAADGVTLSTVHRVKGREWPHVVVLGVEEGAFPHRLAGDVEEERRVFHVAITRCRTDAVVIASSGNPSRFCAELTGTAARRPPTPKAPIPAATRAAPRKVDQPAQPAVGARVGMVVGIAGGYDADIVAIEDAGVVVVPAGGTARMHLRWGATVAVHGKPARLVRPGSPSPDEALAALKAWRRETATRDRVPAYVVFSDDHLAGIAAALPATLEELAPCRGIGPTKLDRYGDEILATLLAAGSQPEQ